MCVFITLFKVKTILTWQSNKGAVPAIALRLKLCLEILEKRGVQHPSENLIRRSIRRSIRQNDLGATTNMSQWFNKLGLTLDDKDVTRKDKQQKVCVYIRRSFLNEDVLQKLDKGTLYVMAFPFLRSFFNMTHVKDRSTYRIYVFPTITQF